MTTYYDRLNAFFNANELKPLAPSAQLTFLHLLHENNRLGNTGTFRCSDIRLATVTGLSRQTITTAKRVLKNQGFIDFKTNSPRAGTTYTLPELNAKPNDGRQIETIGASISGDLRKTWKFNNDGFTPTESEVFYLSDDVKLYGEEIVKRAITLAGQKKLGRLSIYFYKRQLLMITSGRKESGSNVKPDNGLVSQYCGIGVDTAPED